VPVWLDWNNDGRLDLYAVNVRRPGDLLSANRLMLQQVDGSFVELAEMQKQTTDHASAQLIYLDGAMHLIAHTGAAPYPGAFHRVGDPNPLPFVFAGSTTNTLHSDLYDVAVGDFDGDLQEEMFMTRLKGRGKSYRVTTDGKTLETYVNNLGSERGVSWAAPSATTARIRLWGWSPAQIRIGTRGVAVPVSRFTADYEGYPLWRGEVQIDLTRPDLSGMLPPAGRRKSGVYFGRSADGRLHLYAKGGSGQALQLEFTVDQGPITDVKSTGFNFRTNLARVPNFLFRVDGGFRDRAADWRMAVPLACGSVVAADFDNDMDLDLFMNCTQGIGGSFNRVFENQGGYFVEVPLGAGATQVPSDYPGGAVSFADYDNDGYVDVLVSEGCEVCGPFKRFGRRLLMKNILYTTSSNHWVQVDLVGCQSNRDAIGARVVIDAGGRKQMRLANGGMHKDGQNQRRIHFGLAQYAVVDNLRVEWPSGRVTEIAGLAADQIHRIQEDPACMGR
jgi:hypothetical protein